MNVAGTAPFFAAALIITGVLLSGPVDMTDRSVDRSQLGTGNATLTDVSLPSAVEFQRGRFGSDGYYLLVPPARVTFESIRGYPTLSYEIEIPALGFNRESVHFLDPEMQGRLDLTFDQNVFEPAAINRSAYEGQLRLVLRYNGTSRTVARRNVTIEVRE